MTLRIQSGSARGRSLIATPKGLEVRPILARMRKSLFDILRPRISGARFLDLFAGTGAVGLEALSNGAGSVVFVDASSASLRMIQENAAHLGFAGRARIERGDATGDLGWLGPATFDIIFMGPPYKDDAKNPLSLTLQAVAAVGKANLAGPEAWVIGQHHKKESMSPLPAGWEIFRANPYGDTIISFFRKIS